MKIIQIHAPQWRRESNHSFPQRQLSARVHVFLGILLLMGGFLAHAQEPTVAEELRAAQLMEWALLARQPGPEELRRMESIYADLVAKYPADASVKNGQAEFFWNRGEHARALEAWQAAEKIDPRHAEVLDHLGGSFLALGNARKAAGYFTRAITQAPDNAAYHYNYANVAFLFRHELLSETHPDAAAVLRDALKHFAESSRLDPRNLDYARSYAETFYIVPDADWQAAARAWQHFCDISTKKDFGLVNLARIQIKLGDHTAARATLQRVESPEYARIKARLEQQLAGQ